ncbi:hypothetical protein [Parafrankia sp. EUN1f]|uniref:hypothetical protein n=1 Tax=Parafrankia sp. EUN1f TaxID=102897 RepID=UPI0012F88037|nr:hypothetical protein [Parafrankia sp. EUN1f]
MPHSAQCCQCSRMCFAAVVGVMPGLADPPDGSRVICGDFSPHLSTRTNSRVGDRPAAANVKIAHTPTGWSGLNRIEAQFRVLRYFAFDGTDVA